MLNSTWGPDHSWEMLGEKQIYWRKHGMVFGDYLFEKNLLVELYKDGKITLREMLYRWKRDAKPHKEDFDDLLKIVERGLMV